MKITDFTFIDEMENYDKINNPLKLSVYALLPIGIKWKYCEKEYKIKNGNKIIAKLLKDNKHIAVIEIPKNRTLNDAYIISGNNTQEYNIRNILNKTELTITSPYITGENNHIKLNKNAAIFNDVYYAYNELYFFIFIENEYYKFTFDLKTGNIGKLIVSQ
jgi:hypothetical protein